MKTLISVEKAGQTLWLSAQKAVYWEAGKSLIVSDLHFGKIGHFRKAGIGLPQKVFQDDLHRLFSLIQFFQPRELIIVGDFFHSHYNRELDWFVRWRKDHSELTCNLVMGNHDILHHQWYQDHQINVLENIYRKAPFCFVHDWELANQNTLEGYCFTGHIHPGIRISGIGKQSLRFPCFYFDQQYAILPAFGNFTGLSLIQPARGSQVFAITPDQVLPIQ